MASIGLAPRAGSFSRHAQHHSSLKAKIPQARVVTVCMGRNDGASGNKRRNSKRPQRSNTADFGPSLDAGLLDDLAPGPGPSSSRAKFPSEAGPRERGGSTGIRGSRSSKRGDEDDEEEGRGWWQRPEERSLQAYAAPTLDRWQEERLQLAYATGRRKAQVQELARELDVDRSVVIAWFKEFALRPQSERDAILTARRTEAAAQAAIQPAPRNAEPPAETLGRSEEPVESSQGRTKGPDTGFVPFYVRKQEVGKQKRISGEATRTLEAIYDRTPFPSSDVVRGVYELHRLSRETVMEWFTARRAEDGITSSTQKRAARPSLRERDRNIEGAFTGVPVEPGPRGNGGRPSNAEAGGLLAQLSGETQEEAPPTVITLSRREMAALRSSLPSPNKHKGRMMAEKAGIKPVEDAAAPGMQIGNVQYVEDVVSAEAMADKLRAARRFRSGLSAVGGSGRRLRVRGRTGGAGPSDSEGEE